MMRIRWMGGMVDYPRLPSCPYKITKTKQMGPFAEITSRSCAGIESEEQDVKYMCIRQTLSQLLSIQLQYHSCMNIQARPNFADDFVLSFFKYGRTAVVWSSRLMCLVAALEASICYLSRPATQSHFQGHIHLRRWIAQLALPWLAMPVQRPLNTKWILSLVGCFKELEPIFNRARETAAFHA